MRSRRPIRDYYKILGLAGSASPEDILASYWRLAKKHHPDVSQSEDAEFWMQLINEAYDVLSDPRKRAIFDFFYFAEYEFYAQDVSEPGELETYLPKSQVSFFRSIFSNLILYLVGLKGQLDFLLISVVLLVAASYGIFQQAEFAAGLMAVSLVFGAIILLISNFRRIIGASRHPFRRTLDLQIIDRS